MYKKMKREYSRHDDEGMVYLTQQNIAEVRIFS
jgi:hypothetical protein